ncbi:hypothetical protein, partial [Chryseobacterium sp. Leaf394]|uniref:hypothetical protein n=1 Tax=Chryseobacterium sp. Leaf394 TaxID=1736361 RepID=UPI0019D6E6C5
SFFYLVIFLTSLPSIFLARELSSSKIIFKQNSVSLNIQIKKQGYIAQNYLFLEIIVFLSISFYIFGKPY